MNKNCFAYVGVKKEMDGIKWVEEKCLCLTTADCRGCRFFKPKDSVKKHEYYIFQTKITEWIDDDERISKSI